MQANDRVLAPRPAVEDEMQQVIQEIRVQKEQLSHVEVRREMGVIIIDD